MGDDFCRNMGDLLLQLEEIKLQCQSSDGRSVAKLSDNRGISGPESDQKQSAVDLEVLTQISNIVEIMQCKRPASQVDTERQLDALTTLIKRYVGAPHAGLPWFCRVVAVVVELVWRSGWPPKLHKKLVRVMVQMERVAPEMVTDLLTPWSKPIESLDLSKEHLTVWYNLVEVSSSARIVMGRNLPHMVAFLKRCLSQVLSNQPMWTLDRQQWLQLLLKISLQLFQNLPGHITTLLYTPQEGPVLPDLESLISLMLRLLVTEGVPSHCLPLVGTALAFLVGLCPEPSIAASLFTDVFTKLGTDEVIPFGQVRVIVSPLYASSTKTTGFTSFGHLSLLAGLLPCLRPPLLYQPVNILRSSHLPTQMLASSRCDGIDDVSVESQDSSHHGHIPLDFQGGTDSPPEKESKPLIFWLFDLVIDLCQIPEHQYHSFRLLSQWYQCYSRYLSPLLAVSSDVVFQPNGSIITSTLGLVWTHLDSPVEGITELIIESFDMMLKLHMAESKAKNAATEVTLDTKTPALACKPIRKGSADVDLIDSILKQNLSMSSNIKGKHSLMAILIPYTDLTMLIEEHRKLFPELLDCLATNYLAHSSTEVYRALLHKLNREQPEDGFQRVLLPWLVKGLTSDISLLRQNTSHHWLATTMKLMPNSYPVILSFVRNLHHGRSVCSTQRQAPGGMIFNRRFAIHGLMAVLKAGRTNQLLEKLPKEDVWQALQHQDDDVRLDAFSIICISQKKSEPVSPEEMEILQKSIPENMTNDSAPFRQQMQTCLRVLLVRLRDSAISCLKAGNKESCHDKVKRALDFLDWLWMLLMGCLSPGAGYQRLKTSLDWCRLVIDSFTYRPLSNQRKGTTPDTVHLLMAVAQEQGQCDFFSVTSVHLLLSCLLHGTDEVRETTASIFLDFHPWPLPVDYSEISVGVVATSSHFLFATALRLCNHAKPHESESGALLVSMLFKKLVVENYHIVEFRLESEGFVIRTLDVMQDEDGEMPARCFVECLLTAIEDSLEMTLENTLAAARRTPIHGLILACRRCLKEGGLVYTDPKEWVIVIQRLLKVTMKVIDLVMGVLGGKVHKEGTAPSFEQMGLSIRATIEESVGDNLLDEELLTADHRLLMTWAWVNIKEAGLLLGCLVEVMPVGTPEKNGILTEEDIHSVGDMFFKVLTQCRHRGAIEGCNMGFSRFCEHLLRSTDESLQLIPDKLLAKAVMQISQMDLAVSVTRRSAGLPLIITSILTSESKTRQNQMLKRTVMVLLDLAEEPVAETDQRADLPAVHAIHILKAIVKDANVAVAARNYLDRALCVTIEGFASPHWAIRNAATQLFGTLVCRMLGQKRTHEDHVTLMTLPEFLAHYPGLETYLLERLMAGAAVQAGGGHGHLRLDPTTFPVLSLMARLSAGQSQGHCSVHTFVSAVQRLLSNAVCAVRELAARALSSLIPPDGRLLFLQNTIDSLPMDSQHKSTSTNWLHGSLVLCGNLISELTDRERTSAVLVALINTLMDRKWLFTENRSNLVRASYLKAVLCAVQAARLAELPEQLAICLEGALHELLQTVELFSQVARDQVVHPVVTWYLSVQTLSDTMRLERVRECLKSSDPDMILTVLEVLDKQVASGEVFSSEALDSLQEVMWHFVGSVDHCSLMMAGLCLLLRLRACCTSATSASLVHTSETELESNQAASTRQATYHSSASPSAEPTREQCLVRSFSQSNPESAQPSLINDTKDLLLSGVCLHLRQLVEKEKNCRAAGPALQLFSDLISTDIRQLSRDELDEVGSLLADCCHTQNSEWLHLHVARALATLAPTVVDTLTDGSINQVTVGLFISMVTAGIQLLVSEQSQVRRAAADFVSNLYSHFTNTSQIQPLHTTIALKLKVFSNADSCFLVAEPGVGEGGTIGMLLSDNIIIHHKIELLCETAFTLLGGEERLMLQVMTFTRRQGDLCELIAHISKPYTEDLFEEEDGNYYKENVMLASTLCGHLKVLVRWQSVGPRHVLNLVEQVCDTLEGATEVLATLCTDSGAVNVTHNQRVYEFIWGELQAISLLMTAPYITATVAPALYKRIICLLTDFSKIPYLHPHLLDQVKIIARQAAKL